MIAIFSNPRPFVGEFDRIQRNAVLSWRRLPDVEIFLFEDEDSTSEEICQELGLNVVKDVKKNEFGTPLIGDCFDKIKGLTSAKIIAQVNTDIILTSDFVDSVQTINRIKSDSIYYIVGQRTNITDYLKFNNETCINEPLLEVIKSNGLLHPPSGMDYWVFPVNAKIKIPPFVAGRPGIDSWLVAHCKMNNIQVIDASNGITALHQWHDYPAKKKPFFAIECQRNVELGGGLQHQMSIREADFVFDPILSELVRPKGLRRILSFCSRYTVYGKLLAAYRLIKRWTK